MNRGSRRRRNHLVRSPSAAAPQWSGLEALEPRMLMAASVIEPMDDLVVMSLPTATIDLSRHFDDDAVLGTIVEFNSSMGTFLAEMFEDDAPIAVNNFLRYITNGRYVDTFIHRSADLANGDDFVIQGGGFIETTPPPFAITQVQTFPAIQNQFKNSNLRGTLAMARLGGQPNSATSQWFVNVSDNTFLDTADNNGFTVFGRVLGDGMDIVDAIAALPTFDMRTALANTALGELPLVDFQAGDTLAHENLISFSSIVARGQLTFDVSFTTDFEMFNLADTNNDGEQDGVTIDAQGRLQLRFSGLPGIADITVTATDHLGNEVQDTFTIRVSPASGQMGVIDENNRVVRIRLAGAGGLVVAQEDRAGSLIKTIAAQGTTATSVLAIAPVARRGSANVGDIIVTGSGIVGGSLFEVFAHRVNLTGDLFIGGVVRHLFLRDVGEGSQITIQGSSRTLDDSVGIRARDVTDSSLTSQIPIRLLRVSRWMDHDSTADNVTAPSIDKLIAKGRKRQGVNGDFEAGLTLNGNARAITAINQTANSFRVSGDRRSEFPAGGLATVAGSDGNNGVYAVVSSAFASGNTTIVVAPPIASSVVGGTIQSGRPGHVLERVRVRGSLSEANWTLTGSAGNIRVRDDVEDLVLRATQSILALRAASLIDSTVYAGVKSTVTGLPDAADDFIATAGADPDAVIGSVHLTGGRRPAFVNSVLAAREVGFVDMGLVRARNSGTPHGITAEQFTAVTYRSPSSPIRRTILPADATPAPFVDGDFIVRLV